MKPRPKKSAPTTPSRRDQILADFATLRIPVTADQLDAALTDADQNGRSHTIRGVAPVSAAQETPTEPGAGVVVIHDPDDPGHAIIFTLEYPGVEP